VGGLLVLATFGVVYLAATIVIGVPEARALLARTPFAPASFGRNGKRH
jgi:hypothetical protein